MNPSLSAILKKPAHAAGFLLPEKNSQAKREGENPRVGFDKSTGQSICTAFRLP